jgi:hypothetical protein
MAQPFIKYVVDSGIKASEGIHHQADLISVTAIRQKMLGALAKRHGFAYWNVLLASADVMGAKRGMAFKGLTPGYFSRRSKDKEKLLSALDSLHTKDYSNTFSQVGDLFTVFVDNMHYSDKGCRLMAERFTADILNEFGKR